MRKHRQKCSQWQSQAGVCPTCLGRKYRHKPDCQRAEDDEDAERKRLLQKHGIDTQQFDAFLRVLSRHYRKLARVSMH